MFWADLLAKKIIDSGQHKPYWVDDMKTPSGKIHTGSLRGVMIHDFVYKALLEKGKKATYSYVYNDMDAMDGLPAYLDRKKYLPHMGKPLYKIPSPDGGKKSFAQYYADEFTKAMIKIGAKPKIIWSSKLYLSGKMDQVIKTALDNADKIQTIYHKVAGYQIKKNWYPFQVICQKCGKVGTTTVNYWDGKQVGYKCEENKVSWAKGCAYEGKISPFGGTGKLPWKVDWPAYWKVLGVTIEGAGKDHTSAGGSRDIAKEILKKVFDYPDPFDIPYEWILVRGSKMSSSKGVGTSAADFVKYLPPQVARFLFARIHFNKVIDFDPFGDTIPDLFDEYDRCANNYWNGKDDDFARMFAVAQIKKVSRKKLYLPRFRDVAQYLQLPGFNLSAEFARQKGSCLNDQEKKILKQRINYARLWLEKYAPKKLIFKISDKLPKEVKSLSEKQKKYLAEVSKLLTNHWQNPDDLQQSLYEKSKELNLPAKQAFGAIYLALLGKNHGPKASQLLLGQKRTFLNKRLNLKD